MEKYIVERKLLFSPKGSGEKKDLVIRIGAPYLADETVLGYPIAEGTAMCDYEYDGLLPQTYVLGVDMLQALHLAIDIEPFLKKFSSKYDFFWPTGEPYF